MATTVQLKVCGGMHPYTWTKTGNVQLDKTTGILVNVTVGGSPATVPGVSPGIAACRQFAVDGVYGQSGTCTPSGNTYTVAFGITSSNRWDCDGNALSANTPSTSVGSGLVVCCIAGANCSGNSETRCTPGSIVLINGGPANGDPVTVTVAYTNPSTGATFSGSTTFSPAGATIQSYTYPGKADVRTQAMIDAGCGDCSCTDATGATVTVTDKAGVSATYAF